MPIPKKDPKKLKKLQKALERRFWLVADLEEHLDLSNRTVYRYIEELRETGLEVVSKKTHTGDGLYKILT